MTASTTRWRGRAGGGGGGERDVRHGRRMRIVVYQGLRSAAGVLCYAAEVHHFSPCNFLDLRSPVLHPQSDFDENKTKIETQRTHKAMA